LDGSLPSCDQTMGLMVPYCLCESKRSLKWLLRFEVWVLFGVHRMS